YEVYSIILNTIFPRMMHSYDVQTCRKLFAKSIIKTKNVKLLVAFVKI
ncbi:MAG: hypothetical protein ACI90V_009679, partial [Bacillariaceae sp.]